jgi:hypothetical protein
VPVCIDIDHLETVSSRVRNKNTTGTWFKGPMIVRCTE